MTFLLLSLLACQDPASEPDTIAEPTDGGAETSLPAWSGTQIGEEGDLYCVYEAGAWDEEARAGSPWDPDALPTGSWSGSLSAALPDSEADLSVSVVPDGAPQSLLPLDKKKDCPIGVLQPITLTFSAPPLVELVVPAALRATELVVLSVSLDEGEASGELSPGRLPDDAGELQLEIYGSHGDDGWGGAIRWVLERPSGWEEANAGLWQAE